MADISKIFTRLQNGNDVRGSAIATESEPKTLTANIAAWICRAFVLYLEKTNQKPASELRIGIGHDSRLTADEIKAGCLRGLSIVNALDCGLVSTPAMFQSTVLPGSHFDAAIMITASHLPFNRNGLKFFTKDGAISHDQLSDILNQAAAIADQSETTDEAEIISDHGLLIGDISPEPFDLVSLYCEHMKSIIKSAVNADDYDLPLKNLHIVVDAGNGASGFFAEKILQSLGADITGSQFLEPDGHFPNHVPNPENCDAMRSAQQMTLRSNADLGVIFDCDGDRGAVVFSDGTEVNRNTLIALLSAIVAEKHPDSVIVTDSVTSDELSQFLENDLHLTHIRFKRGYKNVIDKGIALNQSGKNCELAIETSGHGAFKENYFSDDGAYIAVKIICKMAQLYKEHRKIEDLIKNLKHSAESREIRFKVDLEDFKPYAAKVLEDFKQFMKRDPRNHLVEPNYEGVRVSICDEKVKGWVLLRMSLHDPAMPMNIESKNAGGIDIIMQRIQPFFDRYKFLVR